MARFVVIGIVLQTVMVVSGHYVEAVIDLSALLGVGIPFVLGIWFGATGPRRFKEAAVGGLVIGILGAALGVLVAILMGDQTWMLMTFAPLSSGVTGMIGGLIGVAMGGRARNQRA